MTHTPFSRPCGWCRPQWQRDDLLVYFLPPRAVCCRVRIHRVSTGAAEPKDRGRRGSIGHDVQQSDMTWRPCPRQYTLCTLCVYDRPLTYLHTTPQYRTSQWLITQLYIFVIKLGFFFSDRCTLYLSQKGRQKVVDVFTKESRGVEFDVDRIQTWYRNHKRNKSKLSPR
jgi:hypothetical protein